jgi:uncharacterized protein involved in response to NO
MPSVGRSVEIALYGIAAFALFVLEYGPMLLRPRVAGL